VVPFTCIVFSPSGAVKSIISPPENTTFRPIDLRQPSQLPKLRGIDYALYDQYLAEQKGNNNLPVLRQQSYMLDEGRAGRTVRHRAYD
jgi:hypothetical protein